MKKTLLTLTLITYLGLPQLSLAATPEQVEQYLLVSRSEEELIAMETQFSAMQNAFKRSDTNQTEDNTYDMQMLSLRFREYIEKHLSEDEMTEVLNNYTNVVLLQFISASSEAQEHDGNETQSYVKQLTATPDANQRIELVEKISKKLYSKEAMMILFDELMKPLMQNGIGGSNMNENTLKLIKDDYLKQMIESSKNETLFASKDFTIEELEALLVIAKTPAIDHEVKAVFGGMAYALKEFFMTLTSRFDVSKHQPKETNSTEHTK
jgi:hypothetical protein